MNLKISLICLLMFGSIAVEANSCRDTFSGKLWKKIKGAVTSPKNHPMNATDSYGKTRLMRVIGRSNISDHEIRDQVRELLEKGADPDFVVNSQLFETPLMLAADRGLLETVKTLISAGANVNAMKANQTTALMLAAGSGHLEVVKALLNVGAELNFKVGWMNPLMSAVEKGHLEVVKALLNVGADVNITKSEKDQTTPLMLAIERGHLEIVKVLLNAGADLNVTKGVFNTTPLMLAIEKGHLEIVKVLLNAGADPNATKGILEYATKRRHLEIVEVLKSAGAKS